MKNENNISNPIPEKELIRKYIANTLTREEELAVAAMYDNDADFRDTLDGLENFSLEEYDELMNKLDHHVNNKINQIKAKEIIMNCLLIPEK
jgi:hypothetical protein